jgi:hypothetical protein
MPVLLGAGLLLFKNPVPDRVRLQRIDVQQVGPRTSLILRVMR